MKRYDARDAIREALIALGHYEGNRPHEMVLAMCRSASREGHDTTLPKDGLARAVRSPSGCTPLPAVLHLARFSPAPGSRSKDIIEPMLKPQWFVAIKGMAKAAADVRPCANPCATPSQIRPLSPLASSLPVSLSRSLVRTLRVCICTAGKVQERAHFLGA